MDGIKAKSFIGGENQLNGESKEAAPADLRAPPNEALPKKGKAKHKKFIDLQKQPPRPKALVQE